MAVIFQRGWRCRKWLAWFRFLDDLVDCLELLLFLLRLGISRPESEWSGDRFASRCIGGNPCFGTVSKERFEVGICELL